MKLKKVSFLIFILSIVNIDAAENDGNDECNEGFCISASVTRTDLESTENGFFKIDGKGQDARMSVLQSFNVANSYKTINVTTKPRDSSESRFYSLRIMPICEVVDPSHGNPYTITKKLLKMLFNDYEGCSDEKKEFSVPMGFSGMLSFNIPVPCDEFEMTLRILDPENSSTALVTMVVNIVPDGTLRCSDEEKAKRNDTTGDYKTIVYAKQIPAGDGPESESTPQPQPTSETGMESTSATEDESKREDDDYDACNENLCMSGTVRRVDLKSTDNRYFKINGEGPTATLTVLEGWDTFETRKEIYIYGRTLPDRQLYSIGGEEGPFCSLVQVSHRKRDLYFLPNKALHMLFPGYTGCFEKPKEYKISTGFSGLFSLRRGRTFSKIAASSDEFEVIVRITEGHNSNTSEILMYLRVFPDKALNSPHEEETTSQPTTPELTTLAPITEQTPKPGGDPEHGTEPMPTSEPEPMPTSEAGGDPGHGTEPMPTTEAGGDPGHGTGPMPTSEPEPMPTSEAAGDPGHGTESMPTSEPEPMPTSEAGGDPGHGTESMPTSEPEPMPTSEAGGDPGHGTESMPTSEPEPMPTSEPEGDPGHGTEPMPTTEPGGNPGHGTESMPTSEPEPMPTSGAGGDPGHETEPMPTSEPKPIPTSEPEGYPGHGTEPMPTSEPEPMPTSEAGGDPGHGTESMPTSEPEPMPTSEAGGDPGHGTESMPTSEPEPMPTSEAGGDPGHGTEPMPTSEPEPMPTSEAGGDPGHGTEPMPTSEPEPMPTSEAGGDPGHGTESMPTSEPEPMPTSEAGGDPGHGTESMPTSEPEPMPTSEAGGDPGHGTESMPTSEPEPMPTSEAGGDPGHGTEPMPTSEPEPMPTSEAGGDPGHGTEPMPTSEPEPMPTSEAGGDPGHGTESMPTSEPEPMPTSEAGGDPGHGTESMPTSEPEPMPTSEAGGDPGHGTEPMPTSEPEPMPTSEAGGDPGHGTESMPTSEPEPMPTSEAGGDPGHGTESMPTSEPEPMPTSEAGGDPGHGTESMPTSEPEPMPTSEAGGDPGHGTESMPTSEPEPMPTSEAGGDPGHGTESMPTSEPEPMPTSEAGGDPGHGTESMPTSEPEPMPTSEAGGDPGHGTEPMPTSTPEHKTPDEESGNSDCNYYEWLRSITSYIPNVTDYFDWLARNNCTSGTDYTNSNVGYADNNGSKSKPDNEADPNNSNCYYFKWLRNNPTYFPKISVFHEWLTSNNCIPRMNLTNIATNSTGEHSGHATGTADTDGSKPKPDHETEPGNANCNYFEWLRNFPDYMPSTNDFVNWMKTDGCTYGKENGGINISGNGSESAKPGTSGNDYDKCDGNYCVSGSVTRTSLSTSDNKFFQVNGEGPSATIRMLKDFNIDDSNEWIVIYIKTSTDSEPKEYYRQQGSISEVLSSSEKDPYPITVKMIQMLFGQYEKSADQSKEYSVPMGFSGPFSFTSKPPEGKFEIITKISQDQDASVADLTMTATVESDSTIHGNGGSDTETDSGTKHSSETEQGDSHCYYFQWLRNLPSFIPNIKTYYSWLIGHKCIPGLGHTIVGTILTKNNSETTTEHADGSEPETATAKNSEPSDCDYFEWIRNYPTYLPTINDYLDWSTKNGCNNGAQDVIASIQR